MDVKELREADGPAVADLFARSRAAAMPWLPVLHTSDEDRAFFADQLREKTGLGVAGPDGLLGFVIVQPGWLDHLYVEPAARGQGIGSALLAEARGRLAGDLQLWAFARNLPALAFYAHHGAIELERTDGRGNEEREPDVRLLLPALAAL